MKKALVFLITFFVIITIPVLAAPVVTHTFDKESYRPGDNGVVTATVTNIQDVELKNINVCLQGIGVITSFLRVNCGIISSLQPKQSVKTNITFTIASDSPSGTKYDALIFYNYQLLSYGGLLTYTDSLRTNLPVFGSPLSYDIGIKLTQYDQKISSVKDKLTSLQNSVKNLENKITEFKSQNKDVAEIEKNLLSVKTDIQTVQNYLSDAENGKTKTVSLSTTGNFIDSLAAIDKALADVDLANALVQNISKNILSIQNVLQNVKCLTGYVLQDGNCVLVQTPTVVEEKKEVSLSSYLILVIVIIVIIAIVAIVYLKYRDILPI